MRLNYTLLLVGVTLASVAPGCGTIIGLDEYEKGDGASSVGGSSSGSGANGNTGGDSSSAGASATGGSDNTGGFACLDDKDGYTTDTGCNSITPSCDESAGNVHVCTGCMTDADCNDLDDCTIDKCESHWCVEPTEFLTAGTACGDPGHACNDSGKCSDCWDTSVSGVDAGCQPGAGTCDTSGPEPICTGCTSDGDCDDGNECTVQQCNAQKQCVLTPVAEGNACSGGVCNGVAGNEACLTCLDDNLGVDMADVDSGCENGTAPFCVVDGNGPKCAACLDTMVGSNPGDVDAGCSATTPFCDTSTGTAACRECMDNGDCGDGVSCTDDTCANHVCGSTPVNANCPSSGDVCKPNQCDAELDCQQVDLTTYATVMDETIGNGSVENKVFTPTQTAAVGWTEAGPYWLVYDCSNGCIGSTTNNTYPLTGDGNNAMWLGHHDTVGGDLNAQIAIPAGAVSLNIIADINFQTQSKAAGNTDTLRIWLENTNGTHLGTALKTYTVSSVEMQSGTTNTWTPDGLSIDVDVTAYAGTNRRISFETSTVDAAGSDKTSFFLDNLRITATVCQ